MVCNVYFSFLSIFLFNKRLYHVQNGGMLQPPMGFTLNATSWPKFLAKTLKAGLPHPVL